MQSRFFHPSSESTNWNLLLKVKALDNEPQGMARSKAPTALLLQGECCSFVTLLQMTCLLPQLEDWEQCSWHRAQSRCVLKSGFSADERELLQAWRESATSTSKLHVGLGEALETLK